MMNFDPANPLPLKGLALSSGKQDLVVNPPIMNSAGILGFAPDARLPFDFDLLGAFVTHPVSLRPRIPALPARHESYVGGVLIHTGFPNPGMRKTIEENIDAWHGSPRPLILHILIDHPRTMAEMIEMLERINHPIEALELGMEDIPVENIHASVVEALQSQLPLLARFPADADHRQLKTAEQAGVNAVVLGPPRGRLVIHQGETISGRLYGPALLPHALFQLERVVKLLHIPVIFGSGLYSAADVHAAFQAGASSIQLDTLLWRQPDLTLADINSRT